MIPRYSEPLVTSLWSDTWTYGAWYQIETTVLYAQRLRQIVPFQAVSELLMHLVMIKPPDLQDQIREAEKRTKHDVAAFLECMRDSAPNGQWLHYGLTSSDLVDTAQGMRFNVLRGATQATVGNLLQALQRWSTHEVMVVGRTHGQPAEPISVGARADHWAANLRRATANLIVETNNMRVAKLSGPVGTFAHNPPELEVDVALSLGLTPAGAGASQIVPRAVLAAWASAAATVVSCCAKVAMDLRLMNLMGEVHWPKAEGQVGSSSMEHKTNPIVAEQIGGLARLAQGYAAMLQPLDLWLERDISHSSVERVAVPDLWHVLFRALDQTIDMLDTGKLHQAIITSNLEENGNALWVHRTTLDGIRDGMGYRQAREFGMDVDVESHDLQNEAKWFMRNYPGGK